MSAAVRLVLPVALGLAGLACGAAHAELFEHLSMSATPTSYEGPCPASIKLESVVKFEVTFNRQEQYGYRWEARELVLTDDVFTLSKGRVNRLEATVELNGPVGKTVTLPIRLHAFWGTAFTKMESYLGKAVNDHYSEPVEVRLTCR